MVLSKSEFIYLILIIAATFLILAVFFISVVVINARNRRQKKIEMLEASLKVQENERIRIARDLHDDIGIILSAVRLMVSDLSEDNVEEFKVGVNEVKVLLDKMIVDTRNIIRNLSPPNLSTEGLIDCIEETARFIRKSKKFQFNFIHEGVMDNLSENAKVNLYRILLEMINNTLKHSNGDFINLSMKMDENNLLLIYSDNGKSEQTQRKNGMGLSNIQQRASIMNGLVSTNKDFTNGSFYHIVFDKKYLISS
jgi:signal transduction histidine kinase